MPFIHRNVFLLGNPQKPAVPQTLKELSAFAATAARVVGSECILDGQVAVRAGAERIIVLGGDGTLLSVGRSLGRQQIPLIGVNLGKLGFLAEFSVAEIMAEFPRAVGDDEWVGERMMLGVEIHRQGNLIFESPAVNDCVVHAGPPFRMISLAVAIDGKSLTEIVGDGLIVCTPNGSTGYNLSAGGPILQAGVEALVVTPLCPHSLTHRPMAVEPRSMLDVTLLGVNAGTTLIIDGQDTRPLQSQDVVRITQYSTRFRLVQNPLYSRWHKLVTKLGWGRVPKP